jgi:hypothetical protein
MQLAVNSDFILSPGLKQMSIVFGPAYSLT